MKTTTDSADFQALVRRAMEHEGRAGMQPVIEKELLHYDILFALDRDRLLSQLTFQGGTSLRLCYGAQRFSEDLDFAGGKDFDSAALMNMKSCIERYVGDRYGLEVTVKEPRKVVMEQADRDSTVTVHKWQIRITTAPGRPDKPKQMIKLEVANVRALTREPQQLQRNYDFLPDGYDDMTLLVESRREIMADKLISFVDCPHLRHRDIWDLQWLSRQGVEPDGELIRAKLADYRIDRYADKADIMIARLPQIIAGTEFSDQMSRFIPLDVQERTLRDENFLVVLQRNVGGLLEKAKELAIAH